MLMDRMAKVGYRASRREYFHEHIEDGVVFLNDWIKWEKPPAVAQMDEVVTYGDPSFKNTKGSDYKAVVTVGRKGRKLYVLNAWVAQATINTMVNVFYDVYEKYGTYSRYYIEANMLQDLLFDDEFVAVGDQRGRQLPIRQDKRKKPDKYTRIENLSPLFERELVSFHKHKRKSGGMKTLIQQLLAFPTGHDDGPDALEAQTGDDRDRQVVRWVLTLSLYYIYDRLPDRIIPERVKENYQDTINILTQIEDGKKSVELTLLTDADSEELTKFRWGSRKARTHDPFLDQYNE